MSTKELSKLVSAMNIDILSNISTRIRLCRNFLYQQKCFHDTKNFYNKHENTDPKLISQAGIVQILSNPNGLKTRETSMKVSTQSQRSLHFRCMSTNSSLKHKNCNNFNKTFKKHYFTGQVSHQKDNPTPLHDTNRQDNAPNHSDLVEASDDAIKSLMLSDMLVYENFIDNEEEESLFMEAENYLKRLRYEFNHWDNAIHGFRETEKRNWNETNQKILERVRSIAFPPGSPQMALVHVLDLAKDGYIKPHVDSVRFCGGVITGLSLLSPSVMRLREEKNPSNYADVLLQPRSLYVMRGKVRYDYTHEILKSEESVFKGSVVPRDRRISVVCRVEPEDHNQE